MHKSLFLTSAFVGVKTNGISGSNELLTKKNHRICLKYGGFYGISHVILRSDMKMQRKIAERCIRYSTKVVLTSGSTIPLPLLDAKIG